MVMEDGGWGQREKWEECFLRLYFSESCLMVGPGGLSSGFSVVVTHHEGHTPGQTGPL